jgi:hypothetical protein
MCCFSDKRAIKLKSNDQSNNNDCLVRSEIYWSRKTCHWCCEFEWTLSLSVTCDRLVVFFGSSGFLHQYNWPPRYSWNIVESGVKHHQTNIYTWGVWTSKVAKYIIFYSLIVIFFLTVGSIEKCSACLGICAHKVHVIPHQFYVIVHKLDVIVQI